VHGRRAGELRSLQRPLRDVGLTERQSGPALLRLALVAGAGIGALGAAFRIVLASLDGARARVVAEAAADFER
jgi:hypothetical protein